MTFVKTFLAINMCLLQSVCGFLVPRSTRADIMLAASSMLDNNLMGTLRQEILRRLVILQAETMSQLRMPAA